MSEWSTVKPWHIQWEKIQATGGVAFAEKVIDQYQKSGVNLFRCEGDPDWLIPILDKAGAKRLVMFVWNSIFISSIPEEQKYPRYMKYVTTMLERWHPEEVVLDHEASTHEYPQMIADIRAEIDRVCGWWNEVPFFVYRGEYLFRPEIPAEEPIGDALCPTFYGIWRHNVYPSNVLVKKMVTSWPNKTVEGGYPWLTPLLNHRNTSSQLVSVGEFKGVCKILKNHGAKGFSFWPSPYSVEFGSLASPRNQECLKIMKQGRSVWAK